MAASTLWIRNNMLGTNPDPNERELTEAELRVQRSLQKLSIPDWYLNNRSNPPKILSNATPIESRPPSWKTSTFKKKPAVEPVLIPQILEETYTVTRNDEPKNTISTVEKGTYKVPRQRKSPENSPRKSSKSSSRNNEVFDTNIPKIKLSTNISRTFPKVSPSRKIRNINIVFPPGPKLDLTNSFENEILPDTVKYSTFILRKQTCDTTKQNLSLDTEKNIEAWKTPRKSIDVSISSEVLDNSKESNVDTSFKIRAFSTPKYAPVNLFSSTIIEDSPKSKVPLETSSFLDKSAIEDSRRTFEETSFLDKKVWEIDQTASEKEDTTFLSSSLRSTSLVREIVKQIDEKNKASGIPPKVLNFDSPCTRFLYSKKKSTELENVVRSKQPVRAKSQIQDIIEELTQRCKFSKTNESNVPTSNKNYVRNLVNALEKGNVSMVEDVLVDQKKDREEEDTGSSSESDAKSAASSTSASLKDTDSNSDSDHRSSLGDTRLDNTSSKLLNTEEVETQVEEDDSVYWIPVPKCKLPRTSSLLSMMSRLSTNGQRSPCISPIRDNNVLEESRSEAWSLTFQKPTVLSRKLFRIDETAHTDSGYSDRSDRSGGNTSESSVVDGTWQEDTRNDSGLEAKASRFKKCSSRRKTMVIPRSIIV